MVTPRIGPGLGAAVNWRKDPEELVNPGEVHDYVAAELEDSLRRARAAGAEGPLEYVGAGAFGIVFCDRKGSAWKVFRFLGMADAGVWIRERVLDEWEWLNAAMEAGIDRFVANPRSVHLEEAVLERECVYGRPGHWGDESWLDDVHGLIEEAMVPAGWTAPEFKGDSYIIQPNDEPKLVDISMAQRIGERLADWVEDVIEGRRTTRDRWHDLAFYLLREMRLKTVGAGRAKDLLDRLVELDPNIRHGFALPA